MHPSWPELRGYAGWLNWRKSEVPLMVQRTDGLQSLTDVLQQMLLHIT